jgi:hypothetical protein
MVVSLALYPKRDVTDHANPTVPSTPSIRLTQLPKRDRDRAQRQGHRVGDTRDARRRREHRLEHVRVDDVPAPSLEGGRRRRCEPATSMHVKRRSEHRRRIEEWERQPTHRPSRETSAMVRPSPIAAGPGSRVLESRMGHSSARRRSQGSRRWSSRDCRAGKVVSSPLSRKRRLPPPTTTRVDHQSVAVDRVTFSISVCTS